MITITRQDYMKDSTNLHRVYFAQFVNENVKERLLSVFDKDTLQKSYKKDEHFNGKLTPIAEWDLMGGFAFSNRTGEMTMRPTTVEPIDIKLLKEAGEEVSSASLVCIYKEAARQVIEE